MHKLAVVALAILLVAGARPALAQGTGPREFAFGFSGMTYLIEESDGVFTDADEHRTPNFGFRFTKASFGERRWGWLVDTELYLGVAHRTLIDVDVPNTIFGLQAFAGPVVAFGSLQAYATIGVNRTTIGKSQIVEVPGLVVVQWVGTGGLSNLWAAQLNAMAASAGGGNVRASVPRYSDVSPAGLFGIAWDFGPPRFGLRLSFDYIPVFMAPTRHNARFSLALAG